MRASQRAPLAGSWCWMASPSPEVSVGTSEPSAVGLALPTPRLVRAGLCAGADGDRGTDESGELCTHPRLLPRGPHPGLAPMGAGLDLGCPAESGGVGVGRRDPRRSGCCSRAVRGSGDGGFLRLNSSIWWQRRAEPGAGAQYPGHTSSQDPCSPGTHRPCTPSIHVVAASRHPRSTSSWHPRHRSSLHPGHTSYMHPSILGVHCPHILTSQVHIIPTSQARIFPASKHPGHISSLRPRIPRHTLSLHPGHRLSLPLSTPGTHPHIPESQKHIMSASQDHRHVITPASQRPHPYMAGSLAMCFPCILGPLETHHPHILESLALHQPGIPGSWPYITPTSLGSWPYITPTNLYTGLLTIHPTYIPGSPTTSHPHPGTPGQAAQHHMCPPPPHAQPPPAPSKHTYISWPQLMSRRR